MGGILLNIVDTAGIRDTDDYVESIGVEKAKKYVQKEDTILVKASHFMKFEEVVEALQKM